jgi:DNA ligase-1
MAGSFFVHNLPVPNGDLECYVKLGDMFMFIEPMLLTDVKAPFEDPRFICELKIDGIRAIISVEERVRIYTRHQTEITARFGEIVTAAAAAVGKGTILDGELVVCDVTTGKPDFEATMRRFSSTSRAPRRTTPGLCFVAFDILSHRGRDTKTLPLMQRKAILEDALHENNLIKRIRYIEKGFILFFERCRSEQLEGIVLKRRDSRYHPGMRRAEWQRVVNYMRDEVVVTGFSKKDAAWSIGQERGGQIVPVGLLEHGLTEPIRKAVFPILRQTVIRETKDFAFVRPLVRLSVRFRHWTKAGKMRLPVLERVIV